MDHARRAVFRHGMPRVREWAVWSLPRPLLALWSVVTCGYLAWIVRPRRPTSTSELPNIALFAALLGCGAFSVEMSRRASEPTGVVKDVYAVWELPIVFLLPGLYALIVPAVRLTLTQWRVRRAPVYRRVYTAAAIGIAYGCARLVFMAVLPVGCEPRAYLWSHTADVAGRRGRRRAHPVGDQPGADPGRLQAGEPGGQDQGRAARQGDAAQRRDRAVRRAARRGGHDDQLSHADRRAAARHAAAALLPARAAAQRGPGRR